MKSNNRNTKFRRFFGLIRDKLLEAFNRRDFQLSGAAPFVSFTFDDFPKSALHVGGSILKDYGVRGTFYAAMGLMGKVTGDFKLFNEEDLRNLMEDGHELGCHTFDHLSCRFRSPKSFLDNVIKGREYIKQYCGLKTPLQFSYPYGHVTFRAKKRVGETFASCRGIIPGINKSPVDLNLLRANSLYSQHLCEEGTIRLFEANERAKGWLIFYTHDISENPSSFGCKPKEFESVVRMAVEREHSILPVGEVILSESAPQKRS